MPIRVKLTQPVICAIRIATAPVAAMSPALAMPCAHMPSVEPTRITGRVPAITIKRNRNVVDTPPKSSVRAR